MLQAAQNPFGRQGAKGTHAVERQSACGTLSAPLGLRHWVRGPCRPGTVRGLQQSKTAVWKHGPKESDHGPTQIHVNSLHNARTLENAGANLSAVARERRMRKLHRECRSNCQQAACAGRCQNGSHLKVFSRWCEQLLASDFCLQRGERAAVADAGACKTEGSSPCSDRNGYWVARPGTPAPVHLAFRLCCPHGQVMVASAVKPNLSGPFAHLLERWPEPLESLGC